MGGLKRFKSIGRLIAGDLLVLFFPRYDDFPRDEDKITFRDKAIGGSHEVAPYAIPAEFHMQILATCAPGIHRWNIDCSMSSMNDDGIKVGNLQMEVVPIAVRTRRVSRRESGAVGELVRSCEDAAIVLLECSRSLYPVLFCTLARSLGRTQRVYGR